MRISIVCAALVFFFSGFAFAQQRECGHIAYLRYQSRHNPKLDEILAKTEKDLMAHAELMELSDKPRKVRVIPVAVHVVWRTPQQNISDSQIRSQIRILNEDFRCIWGTPGHKSHPDSVDTKIEFRLASVDNNWRKTNGITRTKTSHGPFDHKDDIKNSSKGGRTPWDTTKYLNIWVSELTGGLLGYAQFPNGNVQIGGGKDLATDGVVISYRAFGDHGTASPPYNKGRTTTHEVGHWLGLRHIWGDGECSEDDGVKDTPTSDSPNYGTPRHPLLKCNSDDMFENYMDYTEDSVMHVFTAGQAARMHATLDLYRVGLFDWGAFKEAVATDDNDNELVSKVVQTLRQKFGSVPRDIIEDLRSIESADVLESLHMEASLMDSLDEFRASLSARKGGGSDDGW